MGWATEARIDGLIERPFFFDEGGRRKFAVLHSPAVRSENAAPILMCHPYFEEKLWSHRIFVSTARQAARDGHTVMRFDFSGHGDSDGNFEDFGFADLEMDVDMAWNHLRDLTDSPPVILGLRLGGTLAGRASARLGARAVMWQPVLDPEDWVMEVLRTNLAFQLKHEGKVGRDRQRLLEDLKEGKTILIEGYGLTEQFYREVISSTCLSGGLFPGKSPASLTVAIGRFPERASVPFEEVISRWTGEHEACLAKIKEDPFWTDTRRYRTRSDQLVQVSLDWISDRMIGSETS